MTQSWKVALVASAVNDLQTMTMAPDTTPDPADIAHALVFVLARWSPDAVMRWEALQDALAEARYDGTLLLVDPDAPGFDPIAFADRFGLTLHGWGETFVVAAGRVIARASLEEGPPLGDIIACAQRTTPRSE